MTDTTQDRTTYQFSMLLRRLYHSKNRLEAVLPAVVHAARTRLAATYAAGKVTRPGDVELLYRVGMLLSSRPEPISMGELSRDLEVPLSTATRIVDWLVQGDYAQRLPDPDDRRVVRVGLSGTGQEVYELAKSALQQQIGKWLSDFSPEERATLLDLLQRLVDAMERD